MAETVELPMLPSINSGSAVQHYSVSASAPRTSISFSDVHRHLELQEQFKCVLSSFLCHIASDFALADIHTCMFTTLTVGLDLHMSKLHLSVRLLLAEKLVTAPSDATSEVARAVSATERAIRKELELSRISVASSGVGDPQEADPEYQCPICLVASFSPSSPPPSHPEAEPQMDIFS